MLHYPGGWTYDKGQIYGLILCVILPGPFFGSGDPFKWSTIHISQKYYLIQVRGIISTIMMRGLH